MAGSYEIRGENSVRLIYSMGFDPNGKRIKRTKTIHINTKGIVKGKKNRELDKELAKFVAEMEAKEYIKPEKMTLSNFIQEWKENYARTQLADHTLQAYMTIISTRIIPEMGNLQLHQIKPIHIIRFLNGLKNDGSRLDGKKGGLSNGSINFNRRVVKNLFSRAVEWKFIQSNPAENIRKEKEDNSSGDVYTEDETNALFKCLEKEDLKWRLYFMIAVTCGLRKGELLGLQWQDVDLEEGILNIRNALAYTKEKGFFLKSTKTKKSQRTVSIPLFLLPLLKKYQNTRLREKEKLKDEWIGGNYNFVFATWNGKPHFHSYPRTKWIRFLKRNGLRYIRPHDLRHTAATLMLDSGINPKVVSERLGHSSTRITLDIYTHRTNVSDRAAADCFDKLFG